MENNSKKIKSLLANCFRALKRDFKKVDKELELLEKETPAPETTERKP